MKTAPHSFSIAAGGPILEEPANTFPGDEGEFG